jgi:hypothetical protein
LVPTPRKVGHLEEFHDLLKGKEKDVFTPVADFG